MTATASDWIVVTDDGAIRIITFNRPEARNALTFAMREYFCEALDAADQDETVSAVVVTGTDPAFTAGVDFKDHDPAFDARQRRFRVNPGKALRAMRTPVICAINGACVSGGLEIALSSTFCVGSERARFADTHARLDVIPAWGLTALLPRVVGLRKAREMSSTGRFVEAEEALRIGLINHVVPHEQLLPFAVDLARAMLTTPAAEDIRALYDQGSDLTLNGALALETTRVANGPAWDASAFERAGRLTTEKSQPGHG